MFRLKSLLRRHGISLLLLAGLLVLIPGCANGLFYYPTRAWEATPETRGQRWSHETFAASDGTRLSGWWLPAAGEAKGTVVQFHGNALNMSNHVGFLEWLPAAGYNLFVFDYRGYGRSEGKISRKGLVRDGVAAIDFAAAKSPDTPLFVWGQSLGGTVALQSMLRSNSPVRAAIIDSTFISYGRIAADNLKRLPWWLIWLRPLRPLFVSGGLDADDALREMKPLPLFFIHGDHDRVIPYPHSQHLHKLAPGPNKHLWIIPGAGHCDGVLRFPDTVRPILLRFLADPDAFTME
jgi:fermentation-respiration switch protein FrsA (DUF1100 family)